MFAVLFSLSCHLINVSCRLPQFLYFDPKIDAEHAIYEYNRKTMTTLLFCLSNQKIVAAEPWTELYKKSITLIEMTVDLFYHMIANVSFKDNFCYLRKTNDNLLSMYDDIFYSKLQELNKIFNYECLRHGDLIGSSREAINVAFESYLPRIEKELEKHPDITSQYRFRFEIEMFKIFYEHLKEEFSRHMVEYQERVSEVAQNQLKVIQEFISGNCLNANHEYIIYNL